MPAGALVFRRHEENIFLLKEINPGTEGSGDTDPVGCAWSRAGRASPTLLWRAVFRAGGQREETLVLSRFDEGTLLSWRRYVVYPLPDGDVAVLFSDITEEKRLEESLRLRAHALETLLRHHRCLGEVAAVASGPLPLETKLRRIADLVVEGTQFPESAGARVTWYGHTAQTPNFTPTPWALCRPVLQSQIPVGQLEVCYTVESAPLYEGPFSREEVDLAEHVVEQISAAIGLDARLERELHQCRLHEAAMETLDNPLLLLDGNGKVLQVNSAWERWGNVAREELLGDDVTSLARPGRSWSLLLPSHRRSPGTGRGGLSAPAARRSSPGGRAGAPGLPDLPHLRQEEARRPCLIFQGPPPPGTRCCSTRWTSCWRRFRRWKRKMSPQWRARIRTAPWISW